MVDEDGNAVTSSQTVSFNIQRRSDGLWWNVSTSAFDLAAEPSIIAATQVGTTGVYELTLSGAYNNSDYAYTVHITTTGTVAPPGH